MALTLRGHVNFNRGGHPYVVVSEDEAAFSALEQIDGRYQTGSFSSGKRFHEPVAVTVDGAEHTVTGIGAIFYEYTRERNRRTGRVKEIKVENSGQRYAYLQEQGAAVLSGMGGLAATDDLDEDERAAWGDFHSAAREARAEER